MPRITRRGMLIGSMGLAAAALGGRALNRLCREKEYTVADGLTVVPTSNPLVKKGPPATRSTVAVHRGMSFGFYARNGYYGSPQARLEVDRMAGLGIDWVCLIVTVFQDTFASTRQYRDFRMTPADDELRDIIDYIHERGMKVQLRPMLECWDGSQRIHVRFPDEAQIMPGKPITHWENWFNSLEERTLHYARLASRGGCEAYGLDSELDYTVHRVREWRRVVQAARSVFKGHLTTSHTGRVNFLREMERADHWFYDLDSLGTSMYRPVADAPGATLEQMVERLQWSVKQHRQIAEAFGKPFYFGECGCCSTAGATARPAGWDNPGGYDGQEQARYLEAILTAYWDEPWWMGLYWWKWDEQNDRPNFRDDPRGDKGFTIWGKPAADTMKTWYSRTDRRSTGH